jgi:hypothetical protein
MISDAISSKGITLADFFRAADIMHEGALNRAELRRIVLGVKPDFSDEELSYLFDVLDLDKGGTIDIYEFCHVLENAKKHPRNRAHEAHHNPIKPNRISPAEEEVKYPDQPRTALCLGKYLSRRAKKNNERFGVDKYGYGGDARKFERAKMRANRMKEENFHALASPADLARKNVAERWRWDVRKRKKTIVTPGLPDATCAAIPSPVTIQGRSWACRQK